MSPRTGQQSKAAALTQLGDTSATKVTLPFVEDQLKAARALLGDGAAQGVLAEAERAVARAADALEEYEALAVSTRTLVEGDGAEAIRNIENAATEAEAAMADIRRMTSNLEAPVGDFANTGLPQLTTAIQSLEDATHSLDRLVEDVRQSPRDFIARPPSQELEVEP